jgi:hypothetical protein
LPPTFHVRSLSLAEILDEGFRLFRHGFSRFLLFQLLLYVPTSAMLAWGIWSGGNILTEMVDASEAPDFRVLAVKFFVFLGAIMVVQVIAGAIVMVATSRAVADSYLGRPWSTRSILSEAARSFPAAVMVGVILTMLFMVAVIGPLGLIVAIAFVVLAGANGGALILVLGILFGLALALLSLLAAFLLVLRYGLALVVLAVEHVGVRDAMGRSVELMRGRYVRGVALFLILVAVNLLITSVLSAFLPTPGFEGVDPDEFRRLLPLFIRGQMLSTLLGQVAGIFVQIYTSICWTLFYFSARCEAEAFDLSHLAERTAAG